MADLWTKKKKILTRKDRFKIRIDSEKRKEESMERLQIEKEEFYQHLQAEETQQEALVQQDYNKRISSLSTICQRFLSFHETALRLEQRSRNESIQSRYPQLRNLNRIVPWINEYVSEWNDSDLEGKRKRLEFVAQIVDCKGFLDLLDACLENPMSIDRIEKWHECKRSVRALLYRNIDAATYNVLTNIEKEMSYLNADIMYYKHRSEFFIHTIWTVLDKIRNTKDEKFPLRCDFKDCGLVVHLPKTFAYKAFAVRILVMLTDWHFTSDCRTIAELELPQVWRLSLMEHVQNMWAKRQMNHEQIEHQKVSMKAEQEKREIIMNKLKHLIPLEPTNVETITAAPSADETADSGIKDLGYLNMIIEMKKKFAIKTLQEEKQEIEDLKKYFKVDTQKYECNMRKYHIVGGIYHLNLVKQPPQPKLLKDGAMMRMIIGEDKLQEWPYFETYQPPSVAGGHVKQPADNDDEDMENTPENALLAKLVLIVIKLPEHVLWFDAPKPVLWDQEKKYWSSKHIYEAKFNEEKQLLSFRVGKMTAMGLAVFKFNNLPFQSWELKRSGDGSVPEVTFVLTTAILALEFVIHADEVTLTMLENANTSALQELVGVPHKPRTLVKLLRTGGVNIFPSTDAFQYIDGVQLKHYVTENHLYYCMALLCLSRRFSWSRWNSMCGYKKFVLQMREMDAGKGQNELLLVTDQQAFITDSNDVNQAFEECLSVEPGTRVFQPDLWSLAADNNAESLHAILDGVDALFTETVHFMLGQTKIMSYS